MGCLVSKIPKGDLMNMYNLMNTHKHLIAVILVAVLTFSNFAVLFADYPITPLSDTNSVNPHISASNEIGRRGEYVDIVVSLGENPGLFMTSFHLGFDTAVLELISFSQFSPAILPLPQAPLLTANPLPFNFIDFSMNDTNATGGLVTLRFRIRDNAPLGNSTITLTNLLATAYPDIIHGITHADGGVYVSDDNDGEPGILGDVHSIVSGGSGLPGDYVDVTVNLTENPGLFMVSFQLGFDASRLELIGFNQFAPPILPLPQPPLLTANPLPFNFIDFSMNDTKATGELITLRFRIRDNAPLGNANIILTGLLATGYEDIIHDVTHENGVVYVGQVSDLQPSIYIYTIEDTLINEPGNTALFRVYVYNVLPGATRRIYFNDPAPSQAASITVDLPSILISAVDIRGFVTTDIYGDGYGYLELYLLQRLTQVHFDGLIARIGEMFPARQIDAKTLENATLAAQAHLVAINRIFLTEAMPASAPITLKPKPASE